MLAKFSIGLSLLSVIAAIVFPYKFLNSSERPPTIELINGCDNFGNVDAGQLLRGQFTIRNAGGKRLILHKTDSSCDCISSEPELILQSGESRQVNLILDTSRLAGSMRLESCYRTNDPHRPFFRLDVTVDVKPSPDSPSWPIQDPLESTVHQLHSVLDRNQ